MLTLLIAALVTSAYTKLDLDRCKVIDQSEVESTTWRCRGYGGVPLIIENGDERYDVDAGTPDKDELWSTTFDSPPETVEWRLSGGKPFAIIYRLTLANPDHPKTSRLLVETIGHGSRPGCRIADIPGATPNANAVAHRAAATILTRKAVCLSRR